MAQLWNISAFTLSPDPHPPVAPGESFDCPDDEVEARLEAGWSATDPRAGLPAEKAFKATRAADLATAEAALAEAKAAEQAAEQAVAEAAAPTPTPAPAGAPEE